MNHYLGLETNIILKRQFNYRLPKPYSNCEIKEIDINSFNSDFYKRLFTKSGSYTYKGKIY